MTPEDASIQFQLLLLSYGASIRPSGGPVEDVGTIGKKEGRLGSTSAGDLRRPGKGTDKV